MPKFVEFHQHGEPLLVNVQQIVTAGANSEGSWLSVMGEDDVNNVDESYEAVKAKLEEVVAAR